MFRGAGSTIGHAELSNQGGHQPDHYRTALPGKSKLRKTDQYSRICTHL